MIAFKFPKQIKSISLPRFSAVCIIGLPLILIVNLLLGQENAIMRIAIGSKALPKTMSDLSVWSNEFQDMAVIAYFKITPAEFESILSPRSYTLTKISSLDEDERPLYISAHRPNTALLKVKPFDVAEIYEWHSVVPKSGSDKTCKILTDSTHSYIYIDYTDMNIPRG